MFKDRVYNVVKTIKKGSVMTYSEVAKKAGSPKACRAVGNILHVNPDLKNIPCHRVIRSDKTLGSGYAMGGPKVQKKLLEKEGILFKKGKVVGK